MKNNKMPKLIQKHTYHLVDMSPLPILTSVSLFLLAISIIEYLHTDIYNSSLLIGLDCLIFSIVTWLIIVVKESSLGHHTLVVSKGLRIGFILFMISEIMLFVSLFWAFFHTTLVPNVGVDFIWPPVNSQFVFLSQLPATNTALLVWSGIFVNKSIKTLAKSKTYGHLYTSSIYLAITIILGITFLICQSIEYTYGVHFSWDGDIYGSLFFVITGFHGSHVLMGILGLIFCWIRMWVTILFWNKFNPSKIDNFFKKWKQKRVQWRSWWQNFQKKMKWIWNNCRNRFNVKYLRNRFYLNYIIILKFLQVTLNISSSAIIYFWKNLFVNLYDFVDRWLSIFTQKKPSFIKVIRLNTKYELNGIKRNLVKYYNWCEQELNGNFNFYVSGWIVNIFLAIIQFDIRQHYSPKHPWFVHKLIRRFKVYDYWITNLIICIMVYWYAWFTLIWEIIAGMFVFYTENVMGVLYYYAWKSASFNFMYFDVLIELSKTGTIWHSCNSWTGLKLLKKKRRFIFAGHKTLYTVNWYLQLRLLYDTFRACYRVLFLNAIVQAGHDTIKQVTKLNIMEKYRNQEYQAWKDYRTIDFWIITILHNINLIRRSLPRACELIHTMIEIWAEYRVKRQSVAWYRLYSVIGKIRIILGRGTDADLWEQHVKKTIRDERCKKRIEKWSKKWERMSQKMSKGALTPKQHVGLETAVWYWHLVDVIWIIVYLVIYVWGSKNSIWPGELNVTAQLNSPEEVKESLKTTTEIITPTAEERHKAVREMIIAEILSIEKEKRKEEEEKII